MTGVGTATAGKLELYLNGAWVDFSAYVEPPVSIEYGRATAYDPTSPTTFSCDLYNDSGNLTPDNPLGLYFPYLIENVPIRYTVTAPGTGTTYRVFTGFVDSLLPSFGGPHRSSGTVAVAASDNLARANIVVLNSDWVEQVLLSVYNAANTWVEVWPQGSDPLTGQLRNVGVGTGSRHPIILKVPKSGDVGSFSLGESVTDRLLDGMLALTPAQNSSGSIVYQGTVPYYHWDSQPASIAVWFQIPAGTAYPGDLKAVLGQFVDGKGNTIATLYWSGAGSGLTVYDSAGTAYPVVDATAYGGTLKDGDWHLLWIYVGSTATHSGWGDLVNPPNLFDVSTVDIRNCRGFTIGGLLPTSSSKPVNCMPSLNVGPVIVQSTYLTPPTPNWTLTNPASSGFTKTLSDRWVDLQNYLQWRGVISASYAAVISGGGSGAIMARTNTSGRTWGDVVQEVCDTAAAFVWVRPGDGLLLMYDGSGARQPTVDLTIDAEVDMGDVSKLVFKRSIDESPTRVAVSSPAGDVLVINAAAEANGALRAASLSTAAATLADATAAGAWQLVQAVGLRMRSVQLDLSGTPNNLWSILSGASSGAMRPFFRVRLTNLPTSHFGYSYIDGFATGFTFTLDEDGATLDLECIPAGTESRADTGRAGADGTMSLNAAITATATTLQIFYTNAFYTYDTTQFPMDINLNGERITLTSAPSGITNPQTFTGVVRGVSPTVARAHAAVEPIELYQVMIVSM